MQLQKTIADTELALKSLDRLLRLELAAAVSYETALKHVRSSDLRCDLELNRTSHATRVSTLGTMVRERGGTPAQEAGPWLALANLVQAGAALFGDDALRKTLREGERLLTSQISKSYEDLPREQRDMLHGVLTAEQSRCTRRLDGMEELEQAS